MFQPKQTFLTVAFATIAVCSFSEQAQAQGTNGTRLNSPYSRYGLGELYTLEFAPNLAMGGGMAATYSSMFDINLQNPASLGKLRYTSFDAGLQYKTATLTENTSNLFNKSRSNDGGLNYLALAFPINQSWNARRRDTSARIPIQWGMAFSLTPHSQVGYDVAITRNLTNIGEVQYNYIGQGSRLRINWGNGFYYKGFSAGVNIGAVVGKVTERNVATFLDTSQIGGFNEEVVKSQAVKGLLVDIGLQYEHKFKRDSIAKDTSKIKQLGCSRVNYWTLKTGVYGNAGSNLNTTESKFYRRYGALYGSDTVLNAADVSGKIMLPFQIGAGIAFGLENKIMVGLNYDYINGSSYQNLYNNTQMSNAHRIALGAELTPCFSDRDKYLNRVSYRLGGFYGQDARNVQTASQDYRLQKYGITFGLGLPIETRIKSANSDVRIYSFGIANLAFEYGFFGNKALIRESYFQVRAGFTFNASGWFVRDKFR